ncbi:protein rolling stone-like [Styela clava]
MPKCCSCIALKSGIRKIFNKKNLFYEDANRKDFSSFLWCECPRTYVMYRCLMFIFSLGWLISHLERNYRTGTLAEFMLYLTHWFEIIFNVYLLLSVATAMVEIRKNSVLTEIQLEKESASKEVVESTEEVDHLEKDDADSLQGRKSLRWYHKCTWYSYESSLVGSLLITIVYWSYLWTGTSVKENPFDIYQHGLNCVILFIDLSITRLPIKLAHAVQHSLFVFMFMMFSLAVSYIRYAKGYEKLAIYWILDWMNYTKCAVLITLGIFPAMFLLQVVIVGANQVKLNLHRKFTNNSTAVLMRQDI